MSPKGVRSIPVRTGDEVVVTAGDHRKKMGKVIGVDRKKLKIHVEGITREKSGAKEAGKSAFCFVLCLGGCGCGLVAVVVGCWFVGSLCRIHLFSRTHHHHHNHTTQTTASTTIPIPLDPSKVRITKLQLDESRKAILARRAAGRKMLAERKSSVKLAEPGSDPAWQEYQTTLKGVLDGSA